MKIVGSISCLLLILSLSMRAQVALAANTAITGGTYGAACNSGGYFTPSSVSIDSGDTVTISVPANDPYAGGVEVHGFPQGDFVVPRGGSVTTSPITATVSYYGTWPSTGCMKGTGAVTITVPVSTPPSSSGTSNQPSTITSTPSTVTPAKTGNQPSKQGPPSPAAIPANQSTTTLQPSPSSQTSQPKNIAPVHTGGVVAIPPASKKIGVKTVAIVSGSSIGLLAVAAFLVWRFLLRRPSNSTKPPPNLSADQPPPSNTTSGGPPTVNS